MKPAFFMADAWRRLRGSDRYAECLRVLLALSGVVLSGWLLDRPDVVIPALLGAIAAALAETEDPWRHRLTALVVTLACFAVTAVSVQWLMRRPLLFAACLPLSTFSLVMLGAVSRRYATVAGATLILGVYTMIGADLAGGPPADMWREPLLLLAGALWYAVLSLGWSVALPQLAVRQSLARLFDALAVHVEAKAALFLPLRELDRDALQLDLARRSGSVVHALNDTRRALIDRIGSAHPQGATARFLQQYFFAQDVHERISSSHYPYAELAEAFFHSDVLFRCEHLLRQEAARCRRHAMALRGLVGDAAPASDDTALADASAAIDTLRHSGPAVATELLRALDGLRRNIALIHTRLGTLERANDSGGHTDDRSLADPDPRSPAEAWARIRDGLSSRSQRFRHAVRLSLALLAGYAVVAAVHPRHGYWILLTTLFVCQPSYRATRNTLLRRVGGTVAGLLAGWFALRSLPPSWQLPLIVLSGVTFFAARHRRYGVATGAITLFVLMCVNEVGNGYSVIVPRLLATLLGAAIAALAIYVVLPEWKQRRVTLVLADSARSQARYLDRILQQYASARRDDLDYRVARRHAHEASAALSDIVHEMLREPHGATAATEPLLRFLTVSHTVLGHLSTLGAHRQALPAGATSAALQRQGALTRRELERLAARLGGDSADETRDPVAASDAANNEDPDDEPAQLALSQLALIRRHCGSLAALLPALPVG